MSTEDETALLFWRNLITQWHLDAGLPDCGCDDDTADGDFCTASRVWADERFAEREDPTLAGPADSWDHDMWVAAWGRNAPLLASASDFRLPVPPEGMEWLATRLLVGGRCAVELALHRVAGERLALLGRARVFAEPTTVLARARRMLEGLSE